ncbi:hypothetical protein BDZ94DRAFT_1264688 [Collybia nuda]|uniref:Recombination activating protein 2 n=1 Tax=Collybia nuda TaxID=64659 RepID=A0A9P6CCT8_9AGAR|nr:hypothetical protein BDZ94DRAFT_1264688 [Collybia nuda]
MERPGPRFMKCRTLVRFSASLLLLSLDLDVSGNGHVVPKVPTGTHVLFMAPSRRNVECAGYRSIDLHDKYVLACGKISKSEHIRSPRMV